MPRTYSRKVTVKPCILCGLNDDNELLFGKLYHKSKISAHSNCLLFSCGLEQRAHHSKGGILRFLITDILKEVNRGKKLKCFYCKKPGATVGCALGKCHRSFHFPCGANHRSVFQYFGGFSTYCDLHRPGQTNIKIKDDLYCYICCTNLSKSDLVDCLYSPCCKNNWFHRTCLQQYAIKAGEYFFKCPLCNNTKEFIKEMKHLGINIPIKDADWELEENAYQELLYRPNCDPAVCECIKGNNHDGKGAWALLTCIYCGSRATHRHCRRLRGKKNNWVCEDCSEIEARIEKYKREQDENIKQQIADIMKNRPVLKVMLQKLDVNMSC